MKAMLLEKPGSKLILKNMDSPVPKDDEVLVAIEVCAVCRTDLHIVDGELEEPKLPLILGHQVIGHITEIGSQVKGLKKGDRVGIPWLGSTCQKCGYCTSGAENLCDGATFTGYTRNGGFAEQCIALAEYCIPLPESLNAAHTAPLLCGGLIGYRAYKQVAEGKKLGFFGFGSAAHMLTQLAVQHNKEVYAFTRPEDEETQKFALEQGAIWAGNSDTLPSVELDGALIFAPVGSLIPQALRTVRKGGRVVCAGIHMSDIPSFPYSLLWGERSLSSIANLTREDGREFMELVEKYPIETTITKYSLEEANQALDDLRAGKFEGTAVLIIKH